MTFQLTRDSAVLTACSCKNNETINTRYICRTARWIHRVTDGFPHKGPTMWKNFHSHDVIMNSLALVGGRYAEHVPKRCCVVIVCLPYLFLRDAICHYCLRLSKLHENLRQEGNGISNFFQHTSHISRVSCQKGPSRHACAWQIGPCWQDTLNLMQVRMPYVLKPMGVQCI